MRMEISRRRAMWVIGAAAGAAAVGRAVAAPATGPGAKMGLEVVGVVKGVLAKHPLMPAMWGAVVEQAGAVAIGCAGVRKVGDATPVTSGDLVHLGSDTKAMTAVLLGQLVDEKKLLLSDTMAEVFPALKGKMNAKMAGVTVGMLLNHTAGLPHDMEWRVHEPGGMTLPAQRAALVGDALAKAPLTEPGKTYAYSNVGYVILGAVVEAKRGESWELAIRKRLFEPLGMASAGFGPPGKGLEVDQPWGHMVSGGKVRAVRNDNPSQMGPAGRVHCSMEDWGKFVAVFLREDGGGVISRETREALLTPAQGQTYAGGWIVAERAWGGGRVYTHSGSNTMWYCTVWMAPKKGFAVLAAVNCGGDAAAQACDAMCAEVIGGRR
jgi:CubicO group peptidase (beta-lactamase class C family)